MKKLVSILILCSVFFVGCTDFQQQKSDSGVVKATVKVKTNTQGQTIEQSQIIERLKRDNDVGAIKHLYIISSYTGDVLEYSTVKGKVTSGGKRISPKSVVGSFSANSIIIGNEKYITDEVMDENGTYGESANYFYWFDVQDNYHQYFPSGGTFVHISDRPLKIAKASLTFDLQ